MTVEQKAEEYLQSIEGDDCVIITDRKERKQTFIDGYKECEKEKEECQKFIWESVGFKKRGFVNSIQIADYIEKLEKENAELKQDKKDLIFVRNAKADHINELKDQLEKAKDLIEDMYDKIPASHSDYYKDVMERARQFLWG